MFNIKNYLYRLKCKKRKDFLLIFPNHKKCRSGSDPGRFRVVNMPESIPSSDFQQIRDEEYHGIPN